MTIYYVLLIVPLNQIKKYKNNNFSLHQDLKTRPPVHWREIASADI